MVSFVRPAIPVKNRVGYVLSPAARIFASISIISYKQWGRGFLNLTNMRLIC
ncbi:hypothetical protein THIOM_000919 [Candidatus Thiomargarita nelsonii]|uniref:Uncharacterized protein n=1 Tax=Candidatus Thiomargarita nelsonii TaxID=1003181 RepID=A0A176S5P4_9GAMM|nr:hypothetical protein THIOM_000919 [Candidatus Thiomargarita nelsonii]